MEYVGCPFCDGEVGAAAPPVSEAEPCWHEAGYVGRRCAACGVIYLSPRPDEAEMAALYDADAAGGTSAAGHIRPTVERQLDAQYALDVLDRLRHRTAPSSSAAPTLLEVGPGGGQFLIEARARGYVPHAAELNAAQARHLADVLHIPTHAGAITDADAFPGATFDAIFHRDLVSHLHHPLATFRHLRDRLNRGGVMLFETGNGGDLSPAWLTRLGRLSYPEHLYLFGRRSIAELLDRTGFDLLDVRAHSIVPWLYAIRTIRRIRPKPPDAPTPDHADATSANDRQGEGDEAGAVPGEEAGAVRATSTSTPDRSPVPPTTATAPAHPPRHTAAERVKGRLVHTVKYRAFRWLPASWPATLLIAARKRDDA